MNLKEEGFTLVELMIAMVVLAIGILALIHMQVAAMNGNLSANEMTTAMTLAQDEIEQLKRLEITDSGNAALSDAGNNANLTSTPNAASLEHSNADNPTPDNNSIPNPINESGENTGLRRYYRFWNVADNTPTLGAKTVVVFVFWGAVDGVTQLPRHRVTVQTIIGG